MLKKTVAALFIVGTISGCQSAAEFEITQPPQGFRFANDFDTKRVKKTARVGFRTLYRTEKGTLRQVADVTCTLKNSQMSGTFTSPMLIDVPRIQGKPEPLTMKCSGAGFTHADVIQPRLWGTTENQSVSSGGAGVAGLVLSAALKGSVEGIANARNEWVHPFAPVLLNPKKK